jgi:hypothetical protein
MCGDRPDIDVFMCFQKVRPVADREDLSQSKSSSAGQQVAVAYQELSDLSPKSFRTRSYLTCPQRVFAVPKEFSSAPLSAREPKPTHHRGVPACQSLWVGAPASLLAKLNFVSI